MNRIWMVVVLNGWLCLLYSLTVLVVKSLAARSLFLIWNVAYQKHHSQQLKTLVRCQDTIGLFITELDVLGLLFHPIGYFEILSGLCASS